MKVSAYIPAFNCSGTISTVIERLQSQSVPLHEILVIDDGSSDRTGEAARKAGARVIRFEENHGRGNARATAMEHVEGEFVLGCDSTCGLEPDFLERALKWFESGKVAAAFGWLWDPNPTSAVDRWRNRHLFAGRPAEAAPTQSFITTGSLMRRTVIEKAGNFRRDLRHSEDAEMGERIIRAGFKVISDPDLMLVPLVSNSAYKVIERYLRWNFGPRPPAGFMDKLRFANYALKILLQKDLRERDMAGASISLQCLARSFFCRACAGPSPNTDRPIVRRQAGTIDEQSVANRLFDDDPSRNRSD